MEMKKSDLLDRWTILLMKARLDTAAEAELAFIDDEARGIIKTIYCAGWLYSRETQQAVMQLMEANAKIWVLEASLRKEHKNDDQAKEDLSLEEIGKRAIQIREYNKLRIAAKVAIEKFFGGLPDNKVEHASS